MRAGIVVLLLLILQAVYGFNEFTEIQIVGKAFPDNACPEQLFKGVQALSDKDFILQYPELVSTNLICDTNTVCKARALAHDWFQKAIKEENPCQQAFYLGVASSLFLKSKDPLNFKIFHENCRKTFYKELDNKLGSDENIWTVVNTCTTETGQDINTIFTNEDVERLALELREEWQNTEPEIEIPAVQEDIRSWIEKAVEEGKPDTVPASVLEKIWDLSCLYTSERKRDMYAKWSQLTHAEKLCLSYFVESAKEGMNFFTFANCPYLFKDARGEYFFQAQWMLERYVELGFAEKECTQALLPMQYLQGMELQQGNPFFTQFCYYKPLKISQGCIEEFKERDMFQAGKFNEGFATGALVVFLIVVIIIFIKLMIDTAG